MRSFLTKIICVRFCQCRLTHSKGSHEIRKFYKDVSLTKSDNGFEINLDRLKLRTPRGNVVVVPSEPLALAMVEEWRSQDRIISKADMHITSLVNKCIDGKDFIDRKSLIEGTLEYLRTDTVCFRMETPKELVQMQTEYWDPIIKQFEKRFDVTVPTTTGLTLPPFEDEVIDGFRKYLHSFSDWSLVGYEQVVESLKSFCIGACMVNKEISIEHAVFLSNLEAEFQQKQWGAVEWKHVIDATQTRCSLAAALLFVHFNSNTYVVKQKINELEKYNL